LTSISSIQISPKYSVADWVALDLSKEKDWKKAIAIIADRLDGRFFKMVERIQDEDFSGFAVLALDCLLIEALQQFKTGVEETPFRKCGEYFETFLTAPGFDKHFNRDTALTFYHQFRCGILHQAEIKKSSRVLRHGPLVRPTQDGEGLVVNRKKFHAELRRAFASYLRALRRGDLTLRENAKKKMKSICRQ
jgi:hypothetical protein